MARNTSKKFQKLHQKQQIAALRLQGYSQERIADELGLNQATISRSLSAIEAGWRETLNLDTDAIKAEQLAKLKHLETEAWAEWHRSKEDMVRKVAENKTTGSEKNAAASRKSVTSEAQSGNPAYLKAVLSAIAERSKILGVYAPVKHSNTDPTGDEERALAVWIVPPELSIEDWTRQAQALTAKP